MPCPEPPKAALPRYVMLGSGERRWKLAIKVVSEARIIEAHEDKCRQCSIPNPSGMPTSHLSGFWDIDKQAIFINESNSERKRLSILRHELVHAQNDWNWWAFGGWEDDA